MALPWVFLIVAWLLPESLPRMKSPSGPEVLDGCGVAGS